VTDFIADGRGAAYTSNCRFMNDADPNAAFAPHPPDLLKVPEFQHHRASSEFLNCAHILAFAISLRCNIVRSNGKSSGDSF
jgi:hypothetical protein